MRVLDIDLDFFLDRVPDGADERPDPKYHRPWAAEEVRAFLYRQCGLSRRHRLPARVVNTHDEVFYHWRELWERKDSIHALSVVHIDAHADLGMGYTSNDYIQTELLHNELPARAHPQVGGWNGLTEGNYLVFAIACRWIRDLVYVHHPSLTAGTDLPPCIFKDDDPETRIIQLKKYPWGTDLTGMSGKIPPPSEVEPEVPITVVSGTVFRACGPFDFAYLAKSPRYTPETAEQLLPVFDEFLDFSAG